MPAFDREKMKRELLEGTKKSYDQREGDYGAKYFKVEEGMSVYKAGTTKDKPHIIDIIPFITGANFPKYNDIAEGRWYYVVKVYVHKNVGPGKAQVVCPAKNYGNPCPICDEVERLIRDGMEWEDIPITAKHQCLYNVLVMDNEDTESKGVQIWDVPYAYSEKAISSLARAPRGGGFIPFSNPDKSLGKSIAFDVGSDTYKKITGHRFVDRDYDIPDDILAQAKQLDQLLIVHSAEEISKILYGSSGKPTDTQTAPQEETPAPSTRRSLLARGGSSAPPKTTPEPEPPPTSGDDQCPSGMQFGVDIDKYDECSTCDAYQPCAEAADRAQMAKAKAHEPPKRTAQQAPPPAAAPSGQRRSLLRRN